MVTESLTTGVTVTASGWLTNPLTTYSRKACTRHHSLGRHSGLAKFLDEAGDRLAGLGVFADPIFGAVQVQLAIVPLFERLIGANFLNKLAVPRTAGIGDDNAEIRSILCP